MRANVPAAGGQILPDLTRALATPASAPVPAIGSAPDREPADPGTGKKEDLLPIA